MSPTARTLQRLRKDGWTCAIVEQFIRAPGRPFRRDLFGYADILAVRDPPHQSMEVSVAETLAIQACAGTDLARRVAKVLSCPTVAICLRAGWVVEVWAWRKLKVKRGGKAIRWKPNIVEVGLDGGKMVARPRVGSDVRGLLARPD